jgi:hypothetical protein
LPDNHAAWSWLGLSVLVIGVAAAAMIAQASPGQALLRRLGLITKGPDYTSLMFADAGALREQLPSENRRIEVQFTITNSGAEARDYSWQVVTSVGKSSKSAFDGSTRIAGGHSATVRRALAVACKSGRAEVKVSLMNPAESIHEWLACASAPKAANS